MTLENVNWGSVADWVSGLGSVSAAIVALYLSRSAQRIKLRGYCGLRIRLAGESEPQELVFVSVTNIGNRATVICNLAIRTGVWKKRVAIITMQRDIYSLQ
jgi:hypothetical protein